MKFTSLFRKSVIGVLLFNAFHSRSCAEEVGLDELYNLPLVVDNCGVNSMCSALQYFAKPYSFDILQRLNCGPRQEKAISFADMKECAEHYGLKAAAYGGMTPADVLDATLPNSLVIVQTYVNYTSHFFCIYKDSSLHFAIVDKPYKKTDERSEVLRILMKGFTGNALFLSSSVDTLTQISSEIHHPKSQLSELSNVQQALEPFQASKEATSVTQKGIMIELPAELEVGPILPSRTDLETTIKIRNNSEEILDIKTIKGSCSCFTGYKGPAKVDALSQAEFVLHFNPSVMNIRTHSQIVVRSNDSKLPDAIIRINPTNDWTSIMIAEPFSRKVGLVTLDQQSSSSFQFKLLIPSGLADKNFKVTKVNTDADLKISDVHSAPATIVDRTWLAYLVDVHFSKHVVGPFSFKITFETNHPLYREVNCYLEGEGL